MFLRVSNRCKDGKDHRYYSVVENRRVRGGKHVQQTLLCLGEINDTQKAAWAKTIDAIDERERWIRCCCLALRDHPRPSRRVARSLPQGINVVENGRVIALHRRTPRVDRN